MNNQEKIKSSLTRAETLEGLSDVSDMTDSEIMANAESIRNLATSAHMHITRIGAHRDKLTRQLKARPKQCEIIETEITPSAENIRKFADKVKLKPEGAGIDGT